ncbi:MAG: TonB-dependent receptor domain-containing protein [Bacteroidia bacterium]
MIKKIPGIILFLFVSNFTFAQSKLTISGTLADNSDKKALEFATVSLIDTLTKLPKSNTFTNENGKFVFDNITSGDYFITVNTKGFTVYKSKTIVLEKTAIVLDTLFIEKSSKELKEITVVAAKPLLEIETDKIIYNVENDVTLQGMMALDALKKLPFVTVDAEDNIQVKGSSNFKVLLNGKSTSIVAKNPSEALKSFPTALIKRIEVITEPSAKYDADGTAGIINIITQKKVVGYNGNVYLNYSTRGQNQGGGSLNIKWGKLGFSSYFGGNMYKYVNQTTSDLYRLNKTPGYKSRLNQHSTSNSNGYWQWGNMELAYDFDTLHTLSIYASPNGGAYNSNSDQITEIRDSAGLLSQSFKTDINSENKNPSFDIGLDFSKRFKDNEDHEISFSALRQTSKDNSNYVSIQDYLNIDDRDIFNTNRSKNIEHTFNLDYEKPFKNEGSLETGGKIILRNLVSDYQLLQRINSFEEYQENASLTNSLHYNQNVGSIYSVYAMPYKKFRFKVGLRAEQTWINASFNNDSLPITSNYLNLIPTAAISKKIKKIHTLKLNYSKRIQRPWMYYLNPYINNQNPRSISFGNPNLLPEKTHSVSLSWNYFFKQNSLDLSLSNAFTDDVITSFSWLDSSDVSYTTYFNMAKSNSLGFNLSFYGMLFKKMQVWASYRTSYVTITNKLDASLSRSGFSQGGHGSATYNFKYGISATLGGWINRGAPTLQSIRPVNYNYNLAVRKALLKKKLNVGLVANNFLEPKQSLKTVTEDVTFYSESYWNNNLFRYYSISVSYNFGKLRENVSRKKGVTNDDKKAGE